MPIDYKNYPANWFSEIRPRILARAKHNCEQCKVPNGLHILRGTYQGRDVYQTMWENEGNIYCAETSELLGSDYVGEVDPTGKRKMTKVVLTIAHLCHDSKCDNPEHLRALCQRCHLRLDIAHHRNTRRRRRAAKQGQLDLFNEAIFGNKDGLTFTTHSPGFSNASMLPELSPEQNAKFNEAFMKALNDLVVNLDDNPYLYNYANRKDFEAAFKEKYGHAPLYAVNYRPLPDEMIVSKQEPFAQIQIAAGDYSMNPEADIPTFNGQPILSDEEE